MNTAPNTGWIKVFRQICDNEYLWDDKPFARGQAWIDLLMMANHDDRPAIIAGKEVIIRRGQRIISIRQLGERWGWSRHKVADFLNSLQSARMAKIESDTKGTVITIANYSVYQDCETTEGTQKGHRRDTEGHKQEDKNNKKEEEESIEKKKRFAPPSLDEVKAYCLERKNSIDPAVFIDFYAAKGWMVGKSKMKDWRAAVRTWEARTPKQGVKYDDIL